MSMEVSVELRVKNEAICDSLSVPETIEFLEMKVIEEPMDIEMKKSISHRKVLDIRRIHQ